MYSNFQIETADDLVKGFAIAIRDNQITMDDVRKLIMECSDNDQRLTQVVVEKTQIHLECMNAFGRAVGVSSAA